MRRIEKPAQGIQRLLHSALVLSILSTTAHATDQQRIDPAGIPGHLLICSPDLPDQALSRFFELAEGEGDLAANIILFRLGESDAAQTTTKRIYQEWEARAAGSLQLIRLAEQTSSLTPDQLSALDRATGICFVGDSADHRHPCMADPSFQAAIGAFLARAGVLCLSGSSFEQLSGEQSATDSIGLFPNVMLRHVSEDRVEDAGQSLLTVRPDHVLIELNPNSALQFSGRQITALGEGAVQVRLAETANKPAGSWLMRGRDATLDLVGLRRAAMDRVGEKFPPDEPRPPRVESGSLIIIGGGGMPSGIIERFVELAGGEEASILVLPTAMPDPLPEEDRIADAFRRAGAKEVFVLTGRTLDVVESDEYLEKFSNATGLWFGGGRQWRFVDAYHDTKVLPLMHQVLAKGGAIMGSSAGASIQAEYMARGTPIGNSEPMADGYERGLGFLPGAAVDQHFAQRGRFPDMTKLITRYPQLLGIGIDESTAIVVQGESANVVGRGSVHFYDANKPNSDDGKDYESVHPGGSYDLVNRSILEPGVAPQPRERNTRSQRNNRPRPPRPPVTAQERIERYAKSTMDRYDENGDQELDARERAEMRLQLPPAADADQDGKVTLSELSIWLSNQQ